MVVKPSQCYISDSKAASGGHHRERKLIAAVPPRASVADHGRPACWYEIDPTMRTEYVKFTARTIPFLRIITLGIVFAFLYFASSVIVTMLLSILLAYFLDPVVEFLERMHVPRGLGALLVLLGVSLFIGGLGYLVAVRANHFGADWPRYSAILRHAATAVDRKLATV